MGLRCDWLSGSIQPSRPITVPSPIEIVDPATGRLSVITTSHQQMFSWPYLTPNSLPTTGLRWAVRFFVPRHHESSLSPWIAIPISVALFLYTTFYIILTFSLWCLSLLAARERTTTWRPSSKKPTVEYQSLRDFKHPVFWSLPPPSQLTFSSRWSIPILNSKWSLRNK